MTRNNDYTLKKYPFIRLLLFFISGILLQWYLQFGISILLTALSITVLVQFAFMFLPDARKYTLRWCQGIIILLLCSMLGGILIFIKDVRHKPGSLTTNYQPGNIIKLTIEEPLVEKPNSYKALAAVSTVYDGRQWKKAEGSILLYFKKDSLPPAVTYGSQLLLKKDLQQISNSGNPGAFDYKRYCLFHDITAQVFLKEGDFIILPEKNGNWLQQTLFEIRNATIKTLQTYIPGKEEQGVGEALLIGYREDLDKDLVQAYSNTGVVHIIAISGLHLGMIYGLMIWIFARFKRNRFTKILKPIVILFVLWAFTLVAGAVPSIMRSAVMFTFIIIGEAMGRRTYMYNTLAASALCMLVFNPFVLWDVGFLLSYAAVISIVTFMKPVYGWLYFSNKIKDKIWSLTSVTISAQVFTIPIILFYFHQFPNFFLITNFLAVPLSGLILYGEILLLCISFFSWLAKMIGIAVGFSIKVMDVFIQYVNELPYSVWNNIQVNVLQTWLLYGFIIALCIWLMRKSSQAFIASLTCLGLFAVSVSVDFIMRNRQQKLIVYNVPKQSAIDIVQGSSYLFTGDSILLEEGLLKNFHLKPARILYHCNQSAPVINCIPKDTITNINGHSILVLDKKLQYRPMQKRIDIDIIILSKNPRIYINQLAQVFNCKQIVFDSSNPLWKIQLWKKDCDSLHLRFHSIPENGAFVMDL